MEIKKKLIDAFASFFYENSVPYFLGGSMRFGWDTHTSDIDFFVCMDRLSPAFLQLLSLDPNETPMEAYIDGVDYQYSLMARTVHISGFNPENLHSFRRLEEEHRKVALFLDRNSNLVRVMQDIKFNSNVRGKIIYRSILENMFR